MYQNPVKTIFSVWDEKVSSRLQLGINYMPGVFQPFIPEQNPQLCLFSFWVCALFNKCHWWYHALFNWCHWWHHMHCWGPGCIWLCHPEWNLSVTGATSISSLRNMLSVRSLFLLCEKNGETLFFYSRCLEGARLWCSTVFEPFQTHWMSYSEKLIC